MHAGWPSIKTSDLLKICANYLIGELDMGTEFPLACDGLWVSKGERWLGVVLMVF